MQPTLLLHGSVVGFGAFVCAAIGFSVAQREPGYGRRLLLGWWWGSAVSQATAAAGLSALACGVPVALLHAALLLAFCLAGSIASANVVLHLLHTVDGEEHAGGWTLAVAALLLFGALGSRACSRGSAPPPRASFPDASRR